MSRMYNTFGGGYKTNINALKFERDTSLEETLLNAEYIIKTIMFMIKNFNLIGVSIPKNNLYKNFLEKNIDYRNYNSKK